MNKINSRAIVKLDKTSALQHYKILNDNSINSSFGSETEQPDAAKKRNKKQSNQTSKINKLLERTNDRYTDRVSATPTANSINNQLKLTQEKSDKKDKSNDKSNEKSNQSKSMEKNINSNKDYIILGKLKTKNKNPSINDNIYELNQAYSKLSRKKVLSSYDENAVYGMPSKNEKERQSNNYTKSGQKRYHNQSANDDYLCDTDSDEKEEEETIDCEKKNNVRRNKYSSFEASEGKKMASVKYSNLKDKYRVTPESNSKDVETFHTDKYKSSHHNKNLEYLYKDSNPYQEEIIYNPRYPNNNPNYNLSYLYSSGISSNHYGNNNYGNQFNNTSIPTPYNYQQHNMNLQRPKMSQTTAKNDFIFPKNSIGGIDSSRHLNGGLYKDPLSCSYCEEFYKMALFQNVPLQLLSCPYCSNTLNQTSLQFYFRKYETELNESIKKNIEYPNEVSKQTTMSKSSKQPNSHNYPLNGTYECQNLSTYPTRNNLSTNEENRKEEYTNKDMKEAVEYESEHNNEEDNYRHNNYEEKLNKSNSSNYIHQNRLKNHKVIEHEEEDEEEDQREEQRDTQIQKKNKELILIKVDDENENENGTDNLAEMFKKRKLALMEKLEKRKLEKENKPEKEEKKEEINNFQTRKKKVITKKESKKELVQSVKSSVVKEPSQELLQRLSLGEKANLSKKEMKELNQRLISALPDVKKQENDEKKRQETLKRIENTKSFAQKLKEDVVKNKKVNV